MSRLAIIIVTIAVWLAAGAAQASPVSDAGAKLRHMQLVMGLRPTPQPATWTQLNVHPKVVYREQQSLIGRYWHTLHLFQNPPHESAWRCLYRYEHGRGGWASNTGNGYYGGLQMDLGFQRAYGAYLLGAKGTADRWSTLEQMWVGERALRAGRGFYP